MTQKLLQLCKDLASLDEFVLFAEERLKPQPRFYLCAAFRSKAGTEYQFFVPSEGDGPDVSYRTVTALTVATRATEVFIGYMTDLSKRFEEDLGPFQAVFFRADRNGTPPYWFCRMIPEPDAWLIRPFAQMNENPQGRIFLADISEYIEKSPESEVERARNSCERWRPDYTWDWRPYDA
ncbi:MAG: hypothetical protein E5V48_07415 [Mesorhizobium sp.]|nr:MAG: hypothetical protein E5V48_07415 [Mesorhizobium sp.]